MMKPVPQQLEEAKDAKGAGAHHYGACDPEVPRGDGCEVPKYAVRHNFGCGSEIHLGMRNSGGKPAYEDGSAKQSEVQGTNPAQGSNRRVWEACSFGHNLTRFAEQHSRGERELSRKRSRLPSKRHLVTN